MCPDLNQLCLELCPTVISRELPSKGFDLEIESLLLNSALPPCYAERGILGYSHAKEICHQVIKWWYNSCKKCTRTATVHGDSY